MPRRLCSTPGCAAAPTYRGRCQTHAKRTEQQRNLSRADKRRVYNSKRWQQLRKRVLFEQPLCECGEIAVDVDHITSLEAGGQPFSKANVRGMCKSCHAKKTKQESATNHRESS